MMTGKIAIAAALCAASAVAGAKWYPAEDWQDTPDTAASPYARKGGVIRFSGGNPPKSFSGYTDNNTYTRMTFSMMYESLITTDTDTLEFAPYVARRWAVSEDGREFTFIIDERAKWSDGVPVTAADVKWTFDAVMSPTADTGPWKVILGVFESPEIVDDHTIVFRKKGDSPRNWRDLSQCGTFYIMPKHAFEGQDFNKLDFVDAPVGGPYRLSRIAEQVETEFRRVPDWWRADFPSCRNVCNFDRILIRYYADAANAFEAFKKKSIDVYPVYTARIMNGETRGEKFDKNWIVKRRVKNHNPVGFQGFAMNMRRWPFDDIRVRKAMCKLVDRETMNRTMMFYEYFLLTSYYNDLYDERHPCQNPLYLFDIDAARMLLEDAGFVTNPKNGKLEKNGRPFKFTFLSRASSEDKFLSLFNAALMKLGIEMSIQRKDFAGWMRDMDEFNFDMTWQSWGSSIFKNPETMWLSSEADRKGSNNTVGFKSKEVDDIIAAEKSMETMKERTEAYRKIDFLVAAEIPYAFLWQTDETRLLYWNKFGTPDTVLSRYSNEDCIFTYWWYDEDKAAELESAMKSGACLPSVPLVVDYDKIMAKKQAQTAPRQ